MGAPSSDPGVFWRKHIQKRKIWVTLVGGEGGWGGASGSASDYSIHLTKILYHQGRIQDLIRGGGPEIMTGLKLPFWGLSFVEFWCWGLIFGGQGGARAPGAPPLDPPLTILGYRSIYISGEFKDDWHLFLRKYLQETSHTGLIMWQGTISINWQTIRGIVLLSETA